MVYPKQYWLTGSNTKTLEGNSPSIVFFTYYLRKYFCYVKRIHTLVYYYKLQMNVKHRKLEKYIKWSHKDH